MNWKARAQLGRQSIEVSRNCHSGAGRNPEQHVFVGHNPQPSMSVESWMPASAGMTTRVSFQSTGALVAVLVMLMSAWPSLALRLEDIRSFSRAEQVKLKQRYEAYRDNPQLFTEEQFQTIDDNRLATLIDTLILHAQIKLPGPQELVDFAQIVADSGFAFQVLEPKITKYMKEKMFPFEALEKAIKRENARQWKVSQIQKVKDENGEFVKGINRADLDQHDKEKVINIYAVCVAPYSDASLRQAFRPSICSPMDAFKKTKHKNIEPMLRTSPSSDENAARTTAYWDLIYETKKMATYYGLNTFEKIRISKCVAEEALVFFYPLDHPLKTIGKLAELCSRSPEDAFFSNTGVCANFSGMTYNFANELGLSGKVFLAEKGIHVYLEFEEANRWYHVHPFNSQGKCDITQF